MICLHVDAGRTAFSNIRAILNYKPFHLNSLSRRVKNYWQLYSVTKKSLIKPLNVCKKQHCWKPHSSPHFLKTLMFVIQCAKLKLWNPGYALPPVKFPLTCYVWIEAFKFNQKLLYPENLIGLPIQFSEALAFLNCSSLLNPNLLHLKFQKTWPSWPVQIF